MRELRRLDTLDLRGNPVCLVSGYKDVVFNTFPGLLHLDGMEIDPVEMVSYLSKVTELCILILCINIVYCVLIWSLKGKASF